MCSKTNKILSGKIICFIFDKCMHSNPESTCVRMATLFITASIVKRAPEMPVIVHKRGVTFEVLLHSQL